MTFLSGWGRRKSKVVSGSTAGAQTNFQMQLTVYKSAGVDTNTEVYLGTNVRDDFGDVRFTDTDGTSLLDYWIESYTSGVSAVIWIEIDSIPISPGSNTIYIYYDNPAVTTTSNPTTTFLFFDDFDGSSIDLTKWTKIGTVNVAGGAAIASADAAIKTITSFTSTNILVEADHTFNTGEWWGWVDVANAPKGLFYRAGVNNLIINHEANFASNITTGRLWRKITTSITQQRFYESDVELTGSPRAVPNVTPLYIMFRTQSQSVNTIRIRKFSSPEPTFGATGTVSVVNVSSTTADGTYTTGQTIAVTVTFEESVIVVGTPQLQLETGATDRQATYSSGSGSNIIAFNYLIQSGDASSHLDYVSVNSLTLNGGTIKDTNNNDADLTLPVPGNPGSLGANKNIIISTYQQT